jgi:tetratricopeptide (TPR) repeat protein
MELVLNNETIPTLCLNMIVKNESKIIKRLFDSVLPIIDCYCICDTGSTDNTIEFITEYFSSKNIPGKIIIEPFKNFCYNRNFSLKACLGMSDFVLLLDADMVLQIKNFDKKMLTKFTSFNILQGNETFYYQNMRIVTNNGLYNYVGVTHEYIDVPPNNTLHTMNKNQLFIHDLGDGGAKHDKFERDVRLLTEGIKEEPNNERYYFYLANSYHDSGQNEKAIELYIKRISFDGWIEEVWYSYYRIGLCYKNLGKMSDAIYWWMDGYNKYPQRLEGIYEILQHYRIISKYKLFSIFYDIAINILNHNHNKDSYLFLHNDIYTSNIYYEYTIVAAYLGIKNINKEAVIVLNNSHDDGIINNLLTNMKFYKDVLVSTQVLNMDNKISINVNNEILEFYSSSSCIIPNKSTNGYLMNVRYVNYYIDSNGKYLNCDKNIITSNKFIELDEHFNFIKEKWFNLEFDNRLYIGIEDVRIFYDDQKHNLSFIGTGYHNNNNIGIVQGIYNIEEPSLKYNEINPSFSNSSCEKNWVFVNYKEKTHIIYNWHPLKVCLINDEKNELDLIAEKTMPKIFSRARGSTCGFKYIKSEQLNNSGNINITVNENEIWFVVHIVSYEQPRHYYHIIVVFDEDLNLLRYSAPFKFQGECIEYCLGIIVEDERVLINYSTWDRTTRIGIYDKKYIDSILKYS